MTSAPAPTARSHAASTSGQYVHSSALNSSSCASLTITTESNQQLGVDERPVGHVVPVTSSLASNAAL